MPAFDKGVLRSFATVAASQTDTAFLAADSNTTAPGRIAIISLVIVNGATGTSTLQLNSKGSGAGVILPEFPTGFVLPASGQLVLPEHNGGWFLSKVGEGITITTGAGNTTDAKFFATFRYIY